MAVDKLESAIREHVYDRQANGQGELLPLDLYDCLEETMGHRLVIKLGELIMKLKGAGNTE